MTHAALHPVNLPAAPNVVPMMTAVIRIHAMSVLPDMFVAKVHIQHAILNKRLVTGKVPSAL